MTARESKLSMVKVIKTDKKKRSLKKKIGKGNLVGKSLTANLHISPTIHKNMHNQPTTTAVTLGRQI